MKKLLLTFIALGALLPFRGSSQTAIGGFLLNDMRSYEYYSTSILQSNDTAYKVHFRINKIACELIEKDGVCYQKLSFDNFCTLQNPGEPALPTILQHIGIPLGTTLTPEITEHEWKQLDVGKVYPAQYPPVIGICSTFVVCDSIYSCEQYAHPMLKSSETMKWKGVDNTYLTICPFRYHPASNKLYVLADFTLSVIFHDTGRGNTGRHSISEKDVAIFDNYGFLSYMCEGTGTKNATTNDSCDYLIIVGNIPEIENSQSMKTFRRWKALKGYKTKVVSTSTIGSDTMSIKNYITQQYENGIRQVLFIGDNDKIPLSVMPPWHFQPKNELRKSDYWYGCLDGSNDLEAEIPIGRFITNTLDGFSNMVSKTIKYESQYHEWCDRNLLVAHEQKYFFQDVLDTISSLTFHNPLIFYKAYGAPVSMGGLGSDKYDVIGYMNSGVNIVTINCHGNAGGFWMFDGDNSTINYEDRSLLNDETCPVVFSNACYNGDFTDLIHSIAAYFSCSSHCSSAYLGTTMPSFIYAGNKYLRHLYSNLLDNNNANLGNLVVTSHIMNLGFGATAKDNAFNYICGGDPTLEIWTGLQHRFEAVDISLHADSIRIMVANTDSFKVNIVSNDGELLRKYISEESILSMPKPSGNCYISIDKHDYIPYVIRFNVDDLFVQNLIFNENAFYAGSPISIGYDVTTAQNYGNVVVEPNSKVIVNKGAGVKIKNGFECKQGGEFIVK